VVAAKESRIQFGGSGTKKYRQFAAMR